VSIRQRVCLDVPFRIAQVLSVAVSMVVASLRV
jgi:hypothetical protein